MLNVWLCVFYVLFFKKTSEDHCGTIFSASVQLFYRTILIDPTHK